MKTNNDRKSQYLNYVVSRSSQANSDKKSQRLTTPDNYWKYERKFSQWKCNVFIRKYIDKKKYMYINNYKKLFILQSYTFSFILILWWEINWGFWKKFTFCDLILNLSLMAMYSKKKKTFILHVFAIKKKKNIIP